MHSKKEENLDMKVIGTVVDAHGIKGELKVKLFSSETEWHSEFKEVCILNKEYVVEKLRLNKTFWILKLDNLDDRNQAELLKGQDLLADKSLFITEDHEDPYLSELLGYGVYLDNKNVGSVFSFQETSAHFLLVIKTEDGLYEIPYVDAFIDKIERKSHKIHMCFPEDLLSSDYKLEDVE
jgi:16S rRNA processing protein RimM